MVGHRVVPFALLVALVGLAPPAAAATDVTYSGSTYAVSGDGAADVVVVSCLAGAVSPASTPGAPCADVTTIEISTGDGADQVDLSAITRAEFAQAYRVVMYGTEPTGDGDLLRGSQLDDIVLAGDNDDTFGEGGDDVIVGGDEIDAGPGDDTISGGLAPVGSVTGGSGDDRLANTFSSTLNDGGTGDDTLDLDLALWTGPLPSTTTFTAVDYTLTTTHGSTIYPLTSIEHLDLRLPGYGQTINGSAFPGDMVVYGSGGNDTLIGTHQIDVLDGGNGDDIVNARDGHADVVRCGSGDDTATLDAVDQVSGCEHRNYLRNQTSAITGTSAVKRPGVARFVFSSPTPRSTFQCRLDSRAWVACRSPWSVKTRYLTLGWHKVSVRAVNLVGQVDLTPSVRRFRVR